MEEKWHIVSIKGNNFDNKYIISNFGQVINTKTNKELKPHFCNDFKMIRIMYNKKNYNIATHKLVAEYFLPNPHNYKFLFFKDNNPQNCSVDNLIWSNSNVYLPDMTLEEKRSLLKTEISMTKKSISLREKRKSQKIKAILYKGGHCEYCGYDKCINALEFHHLNPETKSEIISRLYNKPWKIIQEELDKCILVCSNCHRVIENNKISKFDNLSLSNKKLSRYEKKQVSDLKIRKSKKEKAILYLGNKCQVCGYDKVPITLEFHHKDIYSKNFQISSSFTKPWEVIKKELDKCVLVCSNCHREIHAGITPCPELIHKK